MNHHNWKLYRKENSHHFCSHVDRKAFLHNILTTSFLFPSCFVFWMFMHDLFLQKQKKILRCGNFWKLTHERRRINHFGQTRFDIFKDVFSEFRLSRVSECRTLYMRISFYLMPKTTPDVLVPTASYYKCANISQSTCTCHVFTTRWHIQPFQVHRNFNIAENFEHSLIPRHQFFTIYGKTARICHVRDIF